LIVIGLSSVIFLTADNGEWFRKLLIQAVIEVIDLSFNISGYLSSLFIIFNTPDLYWLFDETVAHLSQNSRQLSLSPWNMRNSAHWQVSSHEWTAPIVEGLAIEHFCNFVISTRDIVTDRNWLVGIPDGLNCLHFMC
jgi:hypothetical protein